MVLCNLIQGKVRENVKETYLTEFKIILLYINQRRVQDFFPSSHSLKKLCSWGITQRRGSGYYFEFHQGLIQRRGICPLFYFIRGPWLLYPTFRHASVINHRFLQRLLYSTLFIANRQVFFLLFKVYISNQLF